MRHVALPKCLRHCFRMSARGLLLLIVIIGVGLGWIVNAARIQREAVAAIRGDGGGILYDWQASAGWKWNGRAYESEGKPAAPKWIVDRLGVDYFSHVTSASLSEPGSPSTLQHIGRLSRVEKVELHGPFVTDAGLAHLQGLTNLASLDIGDTAYDCSRTIIPLGVARVTDAGMPYLKGLTKLSNLDLNGTQVGDAGLANLAGLDKLKNLQLVNTRVTDLGLAHLEGMPRLEGLELGGTAISDAGLVHLKTLSDLAFLGLGGTKITDEGLASLEGLTKLSMLDLSNTRITDAGLMHLKGLTNLRDLDLRGTQVSDAGVRELQMVLPRGPSVHLGRGNGVQPIVGMTKE